METPPLARGKRRSVSHNGRRKGNTPARAGKTAKPARLRPMVWKHPRSRGENERRLIRNGQNGETPPLARGKPASVSFSTAFPGNTPARAGKTQYPLGYTGVRKKHPRSRGENSVRCAAIACSTETPPLARGKHHYRERHATAVGNTPARAGKTRAECGVSFSS